MQADWSILKPSKNTKFSKNLVDLDIRLLKNYYKSGYYDVKISSNTAELNENRNIDLHIQLMLEKDLNKQISTNGWTFDKEIFNTTIFTEVIENTILKVKTYLKKSIL